MMWRTMWPLSSLAFVAATSPVQAQDRGVVFAGGSAGEAPSVYVGAIVALPGAKLGHGPAVRAVAGFNDYRYDGGAGRVKAREKTATLSAVYQWSGAWGYANLAAGGAYRNTRLTPDDVANPNRGPAWGLVVGADGARVLGAWRLVGLASYQFDLREYYVRVDGTRLVARSLRLGAEAVAQGNPMYDRQLYGAVVAVVPSPKWELRLSGGALVQRRQSSAYAGLSLSRAF